jgi:hypothetical protein
MSGIQSVSISATQSYASASPQSGQSLQPFSNLDLTEAQRTQLRAVFTNAKQNGTSQADVQQQVNAVLSPAQQQTLAADLKAGGAHHGHHHHADSGSSADSTAAPATSSSTDSTESTTSTILNAVTNIQNQAAAAQSTLIGNLQKQVLASNAKASTQNVTDQQTSAE